MILMVKSSKLAVCIAVFAHFSHFCTLPFLFSASASALRSAEQMAALEAKKATESANASESGLVVNMS